MDHLEYLNIHSLNAHFFLNYLFCYHLELFILALLVMMNVVLVGQFPLHHVMKNNVHDLHSYCNIPLFYMLKLYQLSYVATSIYPTCIPMTWSLATCSNRTQLVVTCFLMTCVHCYTQCEVLHYRASL